ncbi:MAG: class I SAM-dependent methyltransferase [Microthrixaceae bacterium]
MVNEYSGVWFDAFLHSIPEESTRYEVEAVTRRVPLPEFRRVLDLCCGPGRHAAMLAEIGYEVTGVDRDEQAIAQARDLVPTGRFLQLDMRDLGVIDGVFDAVVVLWQSFGYFDTATNDQVLAAIAALLRPGGRLLLDVFHRGYFEANQGTVTGVRTPAAESITNTMTGNRLTSTIRYADGESESMEFELYWPAELTSRAEQAGLRAVEACCWWDDARPPTASEQRYQLVLERLGNTAE